METKNEESLLKIRSTRGTVSAGFRLYMGNFKRIFRTTWLPALLLALVSALCYQATANVLILTIVSLLSVIAYVLFVSYVFFMLGRHRQEGVIPVPARWVTKPDGRSLVRTVAVTFVWLIAVMVVFIPCGFAIGFGVARQSMITLGLGLLLVVVMMILLLPLTYPTMRYATTQDAPLFNLLGSGYRQGLRYWGYIFAVLFVTGILVSLILAVTMLPAIILLTANIKAQAGAAMGDPLGMPSYMSWLSFLVFTLSGFIQAYILIASFMPLYYMAGSIEQQEIQRNETTKNTLH